jgi:S-adenosylmethionine-dependent methyltransferase
MVEAETLLCAAEAPLFDEVGSAYTRHLETLRGLIRNHVTRANLSRHLLAGRVRRAIDVGAGSGGDALWLAAQGVDVVMAEPSKKMRQLAQENLARESSAVRRRVEFFAGDHRAARRHFGDGHFDLVLCHGVLMYEPDARDFISSLRSLCAPAALISLTTKNAGSLAFRPAWAGDYATAYDLLTADRSNGTLGVETRAHSIQQIVDLLFELRLLLKDWYGIRIFTDHLSDAAPNEDSLAEILRLETEASQRQPYKGAARLLHVIAQRVS